MTPGNTTTGTAALGASRRRRTKIVATLGPATDDPDVLERLIRAGTDVVRINFSHGSAQEWARRVRATRETAARVGRYVGVIGDLQGPKIRVESFRAGTVMLTAGRAFVLDTEMDPAAGDERSVGVAYRRLPDEVGAGDVLLLDDGQIVLEVDEVRDSRVHCRVARGGRLSNRKGLNKQGGGLSARALTAKDHADIETAAALELDFIAVSFARNAADINEARKLLRAAGGEAYVIAKIERAEAVENIRSIIDASDVIMVARGDLSVEVGYASMTSLQKGLIREARARDKVSITATQMLESMIGSASPTRAEVSDVANAVMDGTDAVMLSAETAIGQYPVEAVATMANVCAGAEKHETAGGGPSHHDDDPFRYVDEAIAMAAMYTANHLNVKAIVALTESGSTALWMSRVRSDIPIYAFTRHEFTRRRVTLYRGVYPVSFDLEHMDPAHVHRAVFAALLRDGAARPGDLVLLTRGETEGVAGGTNTMQIVTVPEV
ncbi:pyruvate kinase [Candidatus Rariloculus sp.]|uniref:pyruvate kinase n=1 Tax=Candidatus Rariloculus sp. TaxID=3101265 RepID=UPI003D0B9C50